MPSVCTCSELIAATVERRHVLGLTSEAVDHVTGLTTRHVQKVEDAGRGLRSGTRFTPHDAVTRILVGTQGHLDGEAGEDMAALLQAALRSAEGRTARPRVPRLDTFALIVQALGGRLRIEWGEPPPVTRRLMQRAD